MCFFFENKGGKGDAGDFVVAFNVGDEGVGAVAEKRHTDGFAEVPEEGDPAGVEVDASDVVAFGVGDEDQGPVWGEGHTAWFVEPGVGKGEGDLVGLEVDEGNIGANSVGDDGVPAVGGD